MAINLYDFHDIIRETYNEYVSRYEIDLVDFKNEYGTDSEPKFIEYQRIYLVKMRDYIIENLSKIDNEDLDSQFYHDKLQEALSDNKKMFQFLNVRLNPMNYIQNQKENTSKDEFPSDVFRDYNSFLKFETYTKRHIISFYKDFSYLKKRMEKENFIMRITDQKFASWLFEKNYISLNDYDIFLKKDKFESLDKARSEQRENNFNNIFFD